MRTFRWRAIGLAATLGLAGVSGCRSAVDLYNELAEGTGGTGGIPEECQGDPTQNPSIVKDLCGVFVDAAASTKGDGTKASPFKTVSEAADAANGRRIFVCASVYAETATVELTNGGSIYGGFGSCPPDGDWIWDDAKRAEISGAAGEPVLSIWMGDNHVEGVNLIAPSAVTEGASSIGIVAEDAKIELKHVSVTAGKGAPGRPGMTPPDIPISGDSADPDSPTDACLIGLIAGGEGAMTTCPDGATQGGNGGKGGTVAGNLGSPGSDGMPMPINNPNGAGLGGIVDPATGACADGKDGHVGDLGVAGAPGVELGTLTSTGITGGDGTDGLPGSRGQGGGGGAGAKAGLFCGNPVKEGVGASGGGGGAGGCGGNGGTGGLAGGSSIGIISIASTFVWKDVAIRTSAGGLGGAGGPGVLGAPGGDGAKGGSAMGGTSKPGCDGGDGGYGGNGGGGGGGRGGHSIGVAYIGVEPSSGSGEPPAFEIGAAGKGGLAGDPVAVNTGGSGIATEMLGFD